MSASIKIRLKILRVWMENERMFASSATIRDVLKSHNALVEALKIAKDRVCELDTYYRSASYFTLDVINDALALAEGKEVKP